MFHNLPPGFLYSPYKLDVTFADDIGTSKTVSGTGFMVSLPDGFPSLVTNRHVLDLNYCDPLYKYFQPKIIFATGRQPNDDLYRFTIDPKHKSESTCILYPSNYLNDVAMIVRPFILNLSTLPNGNVHYHFGREHLADETYFQTALEPFDVVAFAGFPEEHDQLSMRPIVRGGRISSDPKFDFSLLGKAKGQCVAYETFSNSGASGSPVFTPAKGFQGLAGSREGRLVGINAGHLSLPSTGQHIGLSYFYKATVILELLKLAEEQTQPLGAIRSRDS